MGHLQAMRRSRVFVNASSLFGTTLVTSVLGFAFWAVAARVATAEAVGGASAAISVMQLLGSLGTLGLGTLLIGELGRRPSAAVPLVVAGLRVAAVASLVLGVAVGLVIGAVTSHPSPLFTLGLPVVLFAVGTSLTAVAAVVDQALVGLSLGVRQLRRNTVFSVGKLLLLVAAAVSGWLSAPAIYLVWTLGQVVSLVLLWRRNHDPAAWLRQRGGIASLRGLGRAAFAHHLMNVASHAPVLLLPLVVNAVLGASVNAAFYIALLLVGFAWTIPTSLSTALFAVPGDDLVTLARELRLSLRISVVVSIGSAVGFAVLAYPLLLAFGREYTSARWCLVILGCVTLASAVKSLYVAVCRVQGKLRVAAIATTVGSLAEILGGGIGTRGGLVGVAVGLGGAMVLEALVFAPRVVRAARHAPVDPPGQSTATGRPEGTPDLDLPATVP